MKYSRIGIKSVFIFLKKFVFQIFLSRLILVSIIVEKVKNISSVKGKILLTYKKAKIKKKNAIQNKTTLFILQECSIICYGLALKSF